MNDVTSGEWVKPQARSRLLIFYKNKALNEATFVITKHFIVELDFYFGFFTGEKVHQNNAANPKPSDLKNRMPKIFERSESF